MANDSNQPNQQSQQGSQQGSQQAQSGQQGNQNQPPLQDTGEGLLGDTSEDRNLSGSTTWRTIPDQGPQDTNRPEQEWNNSGSQGGQRGQGQSSQGTSRSDEGQR